MLTVQISSSAGGYLQQLRQDTSFGGSLTSWQSKVKGQTKRVSWNWRFYGKEAEQVLSCCVPYLRLKKPQALIGLLFREQFRGKAYKGKNMPQEVILARRTLALRMRDLNSANRKGGSGKGVGEKQYLNVR